MSDQKLSALSSITVASANDIFYIVSTGASSTSQKITFAQVKSSLALQTFAGTGNKYIMTDTGADTLSAYRLVQSGNSITVSTANNNIVINAVTSNISGKQDSITFPLIVGSGGTGLSTTGAYATLLGFSDNAYQFFSIAQSNNALVTSQGTTIFISAITNAGGSTSTAGLVQSSRTINTTYPLSGGGNLSADRTFFIQTGAIGQILTTSGGVTGDIAWVNSSGGASGAVYAPTGGFYVTWSSDTLLASEKILTASDNIVVTTGANNIWVSATTAIPIAYAPTGGFFVAWSSDTLLANEKILTASNNVTITTSDTAIFISAITGAGGSGDITSVGNVASGAAFDGSQGQILTFFDEGTPGATGHAFFRLNTSANQINISSRSDINGLTHDFHVGDETGTHLILAPDQGWIRGYGQAGENCGATFESYGGPESIISLLGAGGTYSIPTVSSSGDLVGNISFGAKDSNNATAYREIANIFGLVDGVVTTGSAPGRLEFYTGSGGSPVKRMIIDSRGTVSFVSSGGFSATLNPHRTTADRTIFTPDSSGTFAIASRYPILLSSGGNLTLGTGGAVGQMLITSAGALGDVAWVNTLGGAAGAVYAPTGGFYVTWSSDTLLANEKILTASDNIVVTTGANNIWISATTSAAGGGSNTVAAGTQGQIAYYTVNGNSIGGSGISVSTGSSVAPFNITFLSSTAASATSGDIWVVSSNGQLYWRGQSSTTIYNFSAPQTIRIPMSLLSVKINSANAFYTAKSGTQMDAGHVQFVDSGLGIAQYWCKIPNNINIAENWNLFFDHEPESGAGGNVAITLCAQVLSDGSVIDANTTVLLSARSFPTYASGTLAITSAATGVMDNTLGLAANQTFIVAFQRLGNNAGDSVSANWNLKNLSVQMDVNT